MKREIRKLLQEIVQGLPVTWVICCFSGGPEWYLAGLQDTILLFGGAALFSKLLIVIGHHASHKDEESEEYTTPELIRNFLIVTVVMVVGTYLVTGR